MPKETHGEIKGGASAQHVQWAKRKDVRDALILDEDFDPTLLSQVISIGYAPDLDEVEIEKVAMDPFLVAYGLRDTKNRIIVSNEISKPSKQRANRKIPDVCASVGVKCCNVYHLLKELDFRTNWHELV